MIGNNFLKTVIPHHQMLFGFILCISALIIRHLLRESFPVTVGERIRGAIVLSIWVKNSQSNKSQVILSVSLHVLLCLMKVMGSY